MMSYGWCLMNRDGGYVVNEDDGDEWMNDDEW